MKELTYEELVVLQPGTQLSIFTSQGSMIRGEIVTFLKRRGANVPDRVHIKNLDSRRAFTYRLELMMKGLVIFYGDTQ